MNQSSQHDRAPDGAADGPDEPSLVLDQAQQDRLCSLVAVGMAATTAAELVAGDAVALERTTAADPRFAARVRQSAAQHEAALLATVSEAARSPKQWRAAVWLLERTRPDTYGRGRANTISRAQFDKVLRSFVKGLFDCVDDPESKRRMARFICQEGLELDRDSSSPAAVPASPAGQPTSQGEPSARGSTSQGDASAHRGDRPGWRSAASRSEGVPGVEPAGRAPRERGVPGVEPGRRAPSQRDVKSKAPGGSASLRPQAPSRKRKRRRPASPPPRHEPARGQQRPVGSALRGVP